MTIYPDITLLYQIALFLVFMVLINQILFKPMLRVIEERRTRTVGRRERAAEAEGKSAEIWKSYQAQLGEAKSVAENVRIDLVRQGETEGRKITETASAEAEKTVTELRARVQSEALEAKKALRAEVEVLARSMAEKILGRAV